MEVSSLMRPQSPHRALEQHRTQWRLLKKSSQRQVRHTPQHPLASQQGCFHSAPPYASCCTCIDGHSMFPKPEAVSFSKAARPSESHYPDHSVVRSSPFAGSTFSYRRGAVPTLCLAQSLSHFKSHASYAQAPQGHQPGRPKSHSEVEPSVPTTSLAFDFRNSVLPGLEAGRLWAGTPHQAHSQCTNM